MSYPSYIRHVDNHHNGCFVACFAMLLGVDYDAAFRMVHPKRDRYDHRGGYVSTARAFKRLVQYGLKPRIVTVGSIKDLHETALIWMRWFAGGAMMHSVLYESKTNKFWDPNWDGPVNPNGWKFNEIDFRKETVVILDGYVPAEGMPPPIPEPVRYFYSEEIYDF